MGDPIQSRADIRCAVSAFTIMETIGADLSRLMLKAGFAPDVVFEETREACTVAAYVLDRITRAEHEAECAARGEGDRTEADLLLHAAIHFRSCMLRRLPDSVDLRILSGDVPSGVEIIRRGEPHDWRP